MVEPDIIFCSFNHIYDRAIHAECPYCKKIKEEQNELNKSLGVSDNDDEQFAEIDEEADSTELLMGQDETELLQDDETARDDRTELLRNHSLEVQEELEDHTELITRSAGNIEFQAEIHDDENRNGENKSYRNGNNPVLGWLVCNSGRQIGRSFEIVSNKNYIFVNDESLRVMQEASQQSYQAIIIANDHKGVFSIEVKKGVICSINGKEMESSVLRNYDVITVNSLEFVFVELMTEFVKWGM